MRHRHRVRRPSYQATAFIGTTRRERSPKRPCPGGLSGTRWRAEVRELNLPASALRCHASRAGISLSKRLWATVVQARFGCGRCWMTASESQISQRQAKFSTARADNHVCVPETLQVFRWLNIAGTATITKDEPSIDYEIHNGLHDTVHNCAASHYLHGSMSRR